MLASPRVLVSRLAVLLTIYSSGCGRADEPQVSEPLQQQPQTRLAPAPANTTAEADFDLSLRDFHGAEGYTLVYDISPAQLTVTLEHDFGDEPRVVWETRLTPEQHERFARFVAELPLDELRDMYESDVPVNDGYQYTYRIRIGDRAERVIRVNNVRQPELDPLIGLINSVVPPKYRADSPRASVRPG